MEFVLQIFDPLVKKNKNKKSKKHAYTARELHRLHRLLRALVDVVAMNMVLNGDDPDYVALLPLGFAILPNVPVAMQGGCGIDEVGYGGSLLTVAFQILVNSVPIVNLSLGSVAL